MQAGGCGAHCFAAQALSDCFSSLHVACQLPGLESTQSTYALSSVGQCRSTVANAASISQRDVARPVVCQVPAQREVGRKSKRWLTRKKCIFD